MGESNISWFAGKLERQHNRERAADAAEYDKKLQRLGREHVGQALAAERGLEGRAAHFFCQGFAGVPADLATPRAEGLEQVFRAGRKALQDKGAMQRVRAAAAAIRARWSFEDFKADKYQVRPCPYESIIHGEF